MTYQRFSTSNNSSSTNSHFYTETEAVEPTQEDIEEFARRIGIDPKIEPHLLHLAREGLMVKLPPDWKPCKDSHRDAWYYYNNQTHISQWEHPMDAIYRDKVIQARSDHAMNRIQNFDLNNPKPLKTLPPLKKSGGGGGLNSFPSTLTKLGPLKNSSFSSSEDLSQFSTNNSLQRNSLQPLEPLLKKSSSLAPLTIPSTPSAKLLSDGNFDQDSFGRPRIRMDPPTTSIAPVKKSGLTLTGAGASFLKSAKSNSNTDLGKIERTEESEGNSTAQIPVQNGIKDLTKTPLNELRPTKSDLTKQTSIESDHHQPNLFQLQKPDETSMTNPDGSLSDTSTGKPLKSILVNSSLKTRSRLDEKSSLTPSTKRNLWDIAHNEMTDEENNQWDALDFKREKPSVKFQLEDPKLVFDISNRDSDEQDETEDSTEEEEEESEEILEEDSPDENETKQNTNANAKSINMISPSLQKPFSSGDGKFVVNSENHESQNQNFVKPLNTTNQRNSTFISEGTRLNFSQESSLATDKNDQVLDRKTIKLNMEAQLREYQTKLEEEGKEQREQIKADIEKTIAQLKSEMESIIAKTKVELEVKKNGEVEKARVQMESTMMSDLDKISNEYKGKLEAKKKELATAHEMVVKSLSVENQEKLNNVKNSSRLADAGKEFERQLADEIKQLKATMTEQHEKQVEDMKALHKTTIQKLRSEFQAEEEKLKKEHADFIVEMCSKFDSEKQSLLRSFEIEQDKIRQEFAGKAAKLTEELNENLETMKKQFEEKSKTRWPTSNPTINILSTQSSNTESLHLGGSKTSIELKETENELSNLRLKYKSLEEKYNSLKRGVHNVVVHEKAKLDKNSYTNTFQMDEDEEQDKDNSIIPDHHNVEDLNNTNNTVDSGAAEESDTSVSFSSIGGNQLKNSENGKTITKMMSGSNDRLNQVLTALEDLKKQMLEIKSGQKKIGNVDLSGDDHFDDKGDIQILHQRHESKKKKSIIPSSLVTPEGSARVAHVSEVRVPRSRVSRSALDNSSLGRKIQTKMTNSSNEIGIMDTNNGSRNHMDDFMKAKDFIKSEKHRLKRPGGGLSFGTPVSTSVGARQRPDYKTNSINHNNNHGEYYSENLSTSSHQRKNNIENKHQNLDHHSETESSGVGSWKERKMEEKLKIGQDIEGILTSLQQLDGQMKALWTVVGGSGGNSPNLSTPIAAPLITSTLRLPQNSGQLFKTQIPMTIPGGNQLQQQIMTKNLGLSPLSPNLITPGNQALINSINVVNSAQFRRSLDTTTNPVLTTLEEHVNNIRNRQSRILQQYPTESNKRDKSPSISEKTKDLREWLERF